MFYFVVRIVCQSFLYKVMFLFIIIFYCFCIILYWVGYCFIIDFFVFMQVCVGEVGGIIFGFYGVVFSFDG